MIARLAKTQILAVPRSEYQQKDLCSHQADCCQCCADKGMPIGSYTEWILHQGLLWRSELIRTFCLFTQYSKSTVTNKSLNITTTISMQTKKKNFEIPQCLHFNLGFVDAFIFSDNVYMRIILNKKSTTFLDWLIQFVGWNFLHHRQVRQLFIEADGEWW